MGLRISKGPRLASSAGLVLLATLAAAFPPSAPAVEPPTLDRIATLGDLFVRAHEAPVVPALGRAEPLPEREDPHAGRVACDRDWFAPGMTPGRRQALLDAARRCGAVPKAHYGLRRSRGAPDTYGYSGDLFHAEWDPVAFGATSLAALVDARRTKPAARQSPE